MFQLNKKHKASFKILSSLSCMHSTVKLLDSPFKCIRFTFSSLFAGSNLIAFCSVHRKFIDIKTNTSYVAQLAKTFHCNLFSMTEWHELEHVWADKRIASINMLKEERRKSRMCQWTGKRVAFFLFLSFHPKDFPFLKIEMDFSFPLWCQLSNERKCDSSYVCELANAKSL